MAKETRYPSYDVMQEQREWDGHTRAIVSSRLIREEDYRFLTLIEAEKLRSICSVLTDDSRGEIIQYIICHIDRTLADAVGEAQRVYRVPPERELIRGGLAALDRLSQRLHTHRFLEIDLPLQLEIVGLLASSDVDFSADSTGVSASAFFNKILTLTVDAYFSHPTVWSEIGYGGPAYPRGYVRTGIGILDPWEAKADAEA